MASITDGDRPVRPERSEWRDIEFSKHHRTQWGFHCPMNDLDFVVAEYCWFKAKALIEYKHERGLVDLRAPGMRVLEDLADRAHLPAFVVRYGNDFDWYQVWALNALAVEWLPRGYQRFTEEEYVSFLYKLRGLTR